MRKMSAVTIDMNDNKSELFTNDQVAKLNEKQKHLLDIMTKYFILTFNATLFTQLELIALCVTWMTAWYEYWDIHFYADYLYAYFFPLDCAVNSICLFLIFEINDKWYKKICKGYHAFIRLCLKKITKRKLRNQYSNDLQLHLLNSK